MSAGEPGSRGSRSAHGRTAGRGGGGSGRGGAGGDGEPPRSRGERFRHWLLYGSWWRHWTWKKALAVIGGGIAAVILLGIAAFFIIYEMTPIPTDVSETANWQSSTVYFANGKQLGTYDDSVNGQNIDRLLLTSNQIPAVMNQAMTAAEDRQFYTEGGVSLTGLLRAAYQDIFGHGTLQGGSTITMQYAKNYYSNVDTGRNLSTKLKEIFIAMKLGHDRSKSWVLTNYLNTVPFGATTYGLGAAAENYFNVNLTQPHTTLTISQAAMLAAMPNEPGFFNPDPNAGAGYTALVARWKYVLGNMVRDGNISQQVANEQKFPQYNPPPAGNGETGVTGYLMNMVEQQLEAPKADGGYGYTQQQIDTGGLKITTTFSLAKINALARSVGQEVAQMQAIGAPLPEYDRIGAVLENSKTGGIVAIYGGAGYDSKHCAATNCFLNTAEAAEPVGSSFKPYVLAAAVNEGMNVFTSKLNGYSPIWIPIANTSVQDLMLSRLTAPPDGSLNYLGIQYFPFNEPSENSGAPLPVNVAAAISSDPAFEDLAHRDGIDSVIGMAKAFGVGSTSFVEPCMSSASTSGSVAATITACNDMTGADNGLQGNFSQIASQDSANGRSDGTPGSPAIALGENPLTPVEQASTFATLADDGVYHTPHVIQTLQKGQQTIPVNVVTRQVLTPQAAADVDWALSFDNQNPQGTAYDNVSFRRGDVIGKTGTLGTGANSSQAWFIGATPDQYALSVALFTNDPGTENLDNLPLANGMPGSQGGGWPATIWNNYMSTEFANAPVVPLFQTVNGPPFTAWIRAYAKKLKTCRAGQVKGCVCPGHSHKRPDGKPCPGSAKANPNPNPTPTCNPFDPSCGNTNPSPTPTCNPFGLPCDTPSPSPTPTSAPSCLPGQCVPTQPPPDQAAKPAAVARADQVTTAMLMGKLRQYDLGRDV